MLDNLHIRIFVVRSTTITPALWKLKNVQNPYWRFYLNQSDGAFIEVEEEEGNKAGKLYPLEAGRAYFIPAMIRFNTKITQEVPHFFVHFDVLGIPNAAMRAIFNNPIALSSSICLRQTAGEIAANLATNAAIDLVLECHVKALIYSGLALYLQSLPPEQLQLSFQLAIALKPVLAAINYISTNLDKSLLNRELALLCQMNEDYFIRRFKECTGQTPGDYIREQRVKLAAQQLLFTEASIEQVAATTGFGSRYYLSRVFKASTGFSPVAYRKAARV